MIIDRDTIQFRIGPWAGESFTVTDREGEQRLADLIPLLNGHSAEHEILDAFHPDHREELRALLNRLSDEGVVIEVNDQSVGGLGGYLTLQPSIREPSHDPLEDSRVLVVNHGQIGRMLIEDFIAQGIGEILLYDTASTTSNLPSQVRRETTELHSVQAIENAMRDAACVVYAEDNPRPSLVTQINLLAIETSTPWIAGRIHGLDGIVGPTIIPGATCCYQCFRTRAAANLDGPIDYHDVEGALVDTQLNSPMSYARVIAGYLVIDAVHLLLGGTGFTAGRIVRFNFFDLSVESNAVLKLPRCNACGLAGEELLNWQRFTSLDQFLRDGES